MVAVDAIDGPFDGDVLSVVLPAPPMSVVAATVNASAGIDAAAAAATPLSIVCVSVIGCVTLEICWCTFLLASVPVSRLTTLSFAISPNAFDTFIVPSSMTFKLLLLLLLLILFESLELLLRLLLLLLLLSMLFTACVMSLIVSAPVENTKETSHNALVVCGR